LEVTHQRLGSTDFQKGLQYSQRSQLTIVPSIYIFTNTYYLASNAFIQIIMLTLFAYLTLVRYLEHFEMNINLCIPNMCVARATLLVLVGVCVFSKYRILIRATLLGICMFAKYCNKK
jgi:hypothetical protein